MEPTQGRTEPAAGAVGVGVTSPPWFRMLLAAVLLGTVSLALGGLLGGVPSEVAGRSIMILTAAVGIAWLYLQRRREAHERRRYYPDGAVPPPWINNLAHNAVWWVWVFLAGKFSETLAFLAYPLRYWLEKVRLLKTGEAMAVERLLTEDGDLVLVGAFVLWGLMAAARGRLDKRR